MCQFPPSHLDFTVDQYLQDYVVQTIKTDTSSVNNLAVILQDLKLKMTFPQYAHRQHDYVFYHFTLKFHLAPSCFPYNFKTSSSYKLEIYN